MTALISGQIVTPADHAAWIAERSSGVGASEVAAACGVSEYEDDTPLHLYLLKRGLAPPKKETFAMKMGKLMEPVVTSLYEEHVGYRMERQQVFHRSPERPWMFATFDALATGKPIAETKTIGFRSGWKLGDEGTDQVVDNWVFQAHAQSYVAESCGLDVDYERIDFPVILGGNDFKLFTVRRDEALLAWMLLRVDEFWRRVLGGDPPPATRGADARLLRWLHPHDDGPLIDADAELEALVSRYKGDGDREKEAKKSRDMAKALILQRLGDNGGARLADGSLVTRKVISKEPYTVNYGASSYVQIFLKKGGK